MFILLHGCENPFEGHVRPEKHASVSPVRCECNSLLFSFFFNRHPLLPARGPQSLLLLPQNHLPSCWASAAVAFPSQNPPKLAAVPVESVVTALQSHRWTATVRMFVILFCQWVNREKRQKQKERVWDTHTPAHTGRTSRRNSGSSRRGTSCRRDGLGGHMAGSCTPDWTSYLGQQRTAAQAVRGHRSTTVLFVFRENLPFLS